ncbi:DUF6712 family protein [Ornithobacterium rhinotracheale]|uniref:DUF6712 family protein n=1 Tax=Ornithobacterium rhinotracheale TaxID=28251 RepID=UPI003FA4C8D6
MELFKTKEDLNKEILVRRLIDIEYLTPYEEVALRRKIHPFISAELIDEIKEAPEHEKAFSLIKKAVAHYTLPLAMPFIKVNISNFGASNTRDPKTSNANWWDIRDMALSAAQIADDALTDAVNLLKLAPTTHQIASVQTPGNIFASPDDFFKATNIHLGWDAFSHMSGIIREIWLLLIAKKLKACSIEDIMQNDLLAEWLRACMANYALADEAAAGMFAFTGSKLLMIWEQLPWQKSAVLSPTALAAFRDSRWRRGNEYFRLLLDYLKAHPDDFPCYQDGDDGSRGLIAKKSGLYF